MSASGMRDPASRKPLSAATAFAVVVAATCTVIAVLVARDPSLEALLEYRRGAIDGGSAYRLLTAHLVHLTAAHATLDIAGLAFVAWIFAGQSTARLLLVTLAAVVAIDASLWFLHPEVERYAGLSGVLHGWFAAGATGWALADRRTHAFVARRAWGIALLVGLVAKLTIEQRGYAFWRDADAIPVVTSAHRWGAAAGALCAGVGRAMLLVRRRDARAIDVS